MECGLLRDPQALGYVIIQMCSPTQKRCVGNECLDALLMVGLENMQELNELQEIEFGRGFGYKQPLSTGFPDLPYILRKELDMVAERKCCNVLAKCVGEHGFRGVTGPPGRKGGVGVRGSPGHPGEEGGIVSKHFAFLHFKGDVGNPPQTLENVPPLLVHRKGIAYDFYCT
ncbi:collagen alpha-4(VI) chain-like [Mauremys mutica]|uniref:collagen alpha-4(VI) chain-like n=1 Tax=Mauremys mutica TaxID=74926 RepID=UPI001D160F89|nr:collagen alpha-4(VI) chain-like [Mauremys mutica]